MKNNRKKFITYLLCAAMVFTSVFIMDTPHAKAENGEITFSISCNGDSSGTVEYSFDDSNWTVVSDGSTISADGDKVYIKATPGEGSQLNNNSNQQVLRYGDITVDLYATLKDGGSYELAYDSSVEYSVQINFDRASGESGGDVSFEIEGNGTVSYSTDGQSSWHTVNNGTQLTTNELSNGDTVYLKAEADSNYELDTNNQQRNRYDNDDHAIDCTDLENGDYHFTYDSSKNYGIHIKFESKAGGGGGGSQVADGKYKVSMQVDSALTEFTPSVDITFLDDSNNILSGPETLTSDKAETDIPQGATQIKVATSRNNLANARLRSSDNEYDLIDDIRMSDTGAGGFALVSIDSNKGYEVYLEFSNKMNVSWSYDPKDANSDKYVEHARIELLISDQTGAYLEQGRTDFNLTIGQDYYFELIPDYGYQIVGLNINGFTVEPQSSVGVFKFTMSDSNFHFQGIVSPAEDKVENTSEMLGGVSIEDNYDTDIKGNLKLSATDAPEDTGALSVVDGEVLGTVDLGLEQIISKGTANNYWKSPLSQLSGDVELSFTVPAEELAPGQTYTIVREHNGRYEELDATYDAATGKLTFATDRFSKYTIVKVESSSNNASGDNQEKGETTKSGVSGGQTSEAVNTPQPIGDVVGGKAINNWNDLDKVLDEKKVTGTQNTTESTKSELVQLKFRNNNTTVPASTFAKLSTTNYAGLHLFTGNGTAVTFINDAKIAGQKTVNIGCSTVSLTGKKVITFKENTKLNTTVVLHATVPAETKMVSVYFTGADQKRTLVTTIAPTATGQLCFAINQLGKYELVYD